MPELSPSLGFAGLTLPELNFSFTSYHVISFVNLKSSSTFLSSFLLPFFFPWLLSSFFTS